MNRMELDPENLIYNHPLTPPTGQIFKIDYKDDTSELKSLVKEFFENYLDIWEESDSGTEFNPITIGCVRCTKIGPLNDLLAKMRTLSEAKPRHQLRSRYDD